MAEDKDKAKGKGKDEAPAKKRLPPVVLVLLGAMVGGAGVVFMAPQPEPIPHGPPPKDIRLYDHPEPMEFMFNPVAERGHHQARVSFVFTYKADSHDVELHTDGAGGGGHGGGSDAAPAALPPVLLAIKTNWNRAYSRCLEVLANEKAQALNDPDGKRRIKRRLIDELSATLFPDGIATVDDILWKGFFVQ